MQMQSTADDILLKMITFSLCQLYSMISNFFYCYQLRCFQRILLQIRWKQLTLSPKQLICCRQLKSIKANMQKSSIHEGIISKKRVEILKQKEKLLVLSNFLFCHNVSKSCLLQRHMKGSVCGKGLKVVKSLCKRGIT